MKPRHRLLNTRLSQARRRSCRHLKTIRRVQAMKAENSDLMIEQADAQRAQKVLPPAGISKDSAFIEQETIETNVNESYDSEPYGKEIP